MKFYKDGRRTIQFADKDQVKILLDAGWSRTKPEVEPEEGKQVKIDAAEAQELADKEAPVPTKPKKIRKILKKK